MAMIIRRVLKSVSSNSRSNSKPNSSEKHEILQYSSTGVFDKIPSDVFLQILIFMGPKEAAKVSTVCKSWNFLVSDNRLWIYFLQNHQEELWENIDFVETYLRLGFPLQKMNNQPTSLSFMHIYGQREQVPGSVIIDGGSGYCKYGWSKNCGPSGRSTTFLEFGDMESPLYSKLRQFFVSMYARMEMKPSAQPLVVSIPIRGYDDESSREARMQLKEAIYNVLFDMKVPAVCAVNQAVLALYAARRTSGIVVNIGFRTTSVVPIFEGKVMHEVGVEVMGQGALTLTGYLRELMQRKNINVKSLYTTRTLKENLCYVAADYERELSKDTQASYEVSGEGQFTLSEERFQTGEILFQPRMGGLRMMGLHRAVALCMDHCESAKETADDNGWFKTVVLAGGTGCLPGLPDRLLNELCKILPSTMSDDITIVPPPYGLYSAWFGAKLVSNLSTFGDAWCMTKKQFRKKYRHKSST